MELFLEFLISVPDNENHVNLTAVERHSNCDPHPVLYLVIENTCLSDIMTIVSNGVSKIKQHLVARRVLRMASVN